MNEAPQGVLPFNTPVESPKLKYFVDTKPVPQEIAFENSIKYDYALADKSPGQSSLQQTLAAGNEKAVRDNAAFQESMDFEKLRLDVLKDYAVSGQAKPDLASMEIMTHPAIMPNTATILERKYADRVLSDLYFTNPFDRGVVDFSLAKSMEKTNIMMDIYRDEIATSEIIKKQYEKLEHDWENQSWLGAASDVVGTLLPFKSWATIADDTELLGENLKKQIEYIYSLPLDQREAEISKRVDAIAKHNILDAEAFLSALTSYGTSDRNIDNAISILDLGSIAGLFKPSMKLILKGTRATRAADVADMLAGAGKLKDAAVTKIAEDLAKGAATASSDTIILDRSASLKKLFDVVPTWENPLGFLAKEGLRKNARAFISRIQPEVLKIAKAAEKLMQEGVAVPRLSESALVKGVEEATKAARREFVNIKDAIIDISHVPFESMPVGSPNLDNIAVRFGKPSGELFDTPEQALHYAQSEYRFKDFQVVPNGDGSVIEVLRPIDETNPAVLDALIETGNTTPRSLRHMIFGFMRTANDVLPKDVMAARKTQVHALQQSFKNLEELIKPIGKLNRTEHDRLLRFTENARDYTEFKKHGEVQRGKDYSTLVDFENDWQKMFGVFPTKRETLGYYAYKRLSDWDYFERNMQIYTGKSRQGIREILIKAFQKERKPGEPLNVHYKFEGRQVRSLDDTQYDSNILVYNPADGTTEYLERKTMNAEKRKQVQEMLDNNYNLIQIAEPLKMPLKDLASENRLVHYVMTPAFESRRLSFQQIPYRPGGHVLMDYEHWVKQPKTAWIGGKKYYTGDTTIRAAATTKEAAEYAANLEKARTLLKAKDELGFKAFVNKNLPETPEDLLERFQNGDLSIDDPIVALRSGEKAADHKDLKSLFASAINFSESEYNLYRDLNLEYAGERSPLGVEAVKGTQGSPLYNIVKPRLVDPFNTATQAAVDLIKNGYLQDYRLISANHFVEEFGDTGVSELTKEQMRANPFRALYRPQWNKYADKELLAAAKNYQRAFINLMGQQTPVQEGWSHMKGKLFDGLYHTLGEKTAERMNDLLLANIDDPLTFTRKATFHLKLGLLNPVQLWKQMQTFVHTAALSPKQAIPASFGYVLQRTLLLSNENPQILNTMAKHATAYGWKKEWFKEAYELMKKTGITNVEGEHAFADDMMDPAFFKSTVGKFLDKASFFFKEGERMTRMAAFNASYLEWRKANPNAVLDRYAIQKIMLRQDTMTVNMSRASNSSLQHAGRGLMSVPTQFLTYQDRLVQQFLGKQLTWAEKGRAVAAYSMMYGVPIGIGGTFGGYYPWYEDLRESELANGVTLDNPALEALHDGIVSTALHWITGTKFDYGQSYGPSGITLIKDILFSDKDSRFLDIMLGASGSTVYDVISTTMPVVRDFANMFSDNPETGTVPLPQDFADLMRNSSGMSQASKLYYGLSVAKYFSKTGAFTDDVNTLETIMLSVFGITPSRINDAYLMDQVLAAERDAKRGAEKEMAKYIRRWVDADDEDKIALEKLINQWRIAGEIDPERYLSVWSEAMKGTYRSKVMENNWNFWKRAPDSTRMKRFQDWINRNNKE